MPNPNKSDRINTLDSFRFFAILSVVLFHYYSCWLPPGEIVHPYPYGNKYDFFSNGYLGVEFFFIISGFVIAYTLYNTNTLVDFFKKRIIRLLPPMVICSFITLLFCRLFDNNNICPEGHSLTNFFLSLTFIPPYIIAKILPRFTNVGYISNSYWSLWPEVQFYFIAGLIYYFMPGKFVRNFSIVSLVLYVLFLLMGNVHGSNIFHIQKNTSFSITFETIIQLFNIPAYSLWFCIGIIFFDIYSKRHERYTMITLFFIAALLLNYYSKDWGIRFIILLMLSAFWIFIYYPFLLDWLNNKFVSSIGLISYTLYLIHQEMGTSYIPGSNSAILSICSKYGDVTGLLRMF
jgi:peptidoglycan/LPS O-acetylase OafA/YrhL